MSNSEKNEIDKNIFSIHKRHLSHFTMNGSLYFITFRTINTKLTPEEQKLVLKHIEEGNGQFYMLLSAIVMPDHVHLILNPEKEYNISRIMKGIKGVSARKINNTRGTTGSIWQNEYYDRILRNENELNEKLNYMFFNSVKKKLTDNTWEYHGWYLNERFQIL